MDLQSSSKAMVFAQKSQMYSDLPKSILCMPIYNGQRQVIGVAQLINKVRMQKVVTGNCFKLPHAHVHLIMCMPTLCIFRVINTFEAFAIFCGLGIHNTQLYEGACKYCTAHTPKQRKPKILTF